jgi:hypothetical protein
MLARIQTDYQPLPEDDDGHTGTVIGGGNIRVHKAK